MNNNNAKINDNNNCGRLEDLILVFKVPMGKRKASSNFIEPLNTGP